MTTTSTFPILKPVQEKADGVLYGVAEAAVICAAELIRNSRGESPGLRLGNQAVFE